MPAAQAVALVYTAYSGPLTYGAPGTVAGQYTLDGITTQFSSGATATFTATADSSTVVSGITSPDKGSSPLYYNLVGTIGITIVDGSTTTNFTAGTQQLGTFQPAAISLKDKDNNYSVIGFGAVNTTTNPNTPTAPDFFSIAYLLTGGTSFYGDFLASTGTFDDGIAFTLLGGLDVTSGSQTGTLQFFKGGDPQAASFTITTADPSPVPGPLPVFGAAAAFGWSRRMRRRLKAGTASN